MTEKTTSDLNFSWSKRKSNHNIPSNIISNNENKEAKQDVTVIDKNANYYNMSHYKRGMAIIFNHYEFYTMSKRNGTNKDCDDIKDVLQKLKFEVKVYKDLKYEKIYEVIQGVSKMNHSDSDCLVVVVMSHGKKNVIYAKDRSYSPDILWNSFSGDKCRSLAGKPKLFFIQACRGDKADSGVKIKSRTASDNSTSKNMYTIPSMADILVMYSSFENHVSFRSSTTGTWFIQCLCEGLRNGARTDDIYKILTFVNKKMAIDYESFMPQTDELHEKKQVGVIFSTLTRQLFFFLEE